MASKEGMEVVEVVVVVVKLRSAGGRVLDDAPRWQVQPTPGPEKYRDTKARDASFTFRRLQYSIDLTSAAHSIARLPVVVDRH